MISEREKVIAEMRFVLKRVGNDRDNIGRIAIPEEMVAGWADRLASAPAEGAVAEPEWIGKLRHDLAFAKATHCFSFTRNEVMELMGLNPLMLVAHPAPAVAASVVNEAMVERTAVALFATQTYPGNWPHMFEAAERKRWEASIRAALTAALTPGA